MIEGKSEKSNTEIDDTAVFSTPSEHSDGEQPSADEAAKALFPPSENEKETLVADVVCGTCLSPTETESISEDDRTPHTETSDNNDIGEENAQPAEEFTENSESEAENNPIDENNADLLRKFRVNGDIKYTVPPPVVTLGKDKISYRKEEYEKSIGIGKWLLVLILLSIPLVNIVMLIVWLASDGSTTKKNFLIAALIWVFIISALAIIIFLIVIIGMMNNMPTECMGFLGLPYII